MKAAHCYPYPFGRHAGAQLLAERALEQYQKLGSASFGESGDAFRRLLAAQ